MKAHQHAPKPAEVTVAGLVQLLGWIVHDQKMAAEPPVGQVLRKEPPQPEKVSLRLVQYVARKPVLNALDCFIMNCLNSVVFKDPSQIIQFHSQKDYAQWPQTRILIKPVPG